MTRRALVIGSQVLGLRGVHGDVQVMSGLLAARGFDVERHIEGDATRDGILDGYRALVKRTRARDAVVVYYAGHGAYALNPSPRAGKRARFQCIVPTDWGKNGEFRGILDSELSALLGQLTARTDNVTVILDCCHSAQMSRAVGEADLVARALPRGWNDGIDDFLAMHPPELASIHVESNPLAVRLVAAEADRSAFELVLTDGTAQGAFTFALETVLSDVGDAPVSWRAVNDRVREIVLTQIPLQRPSVEGPADRILFTSEVGARADAVVYVDDSGKPSLRASRILGANVGAVYEIVPAAASYATDAVIAVATVVRLEGSLARVKLEDPAHAPPTGSLAYPRQLPFPALAVSLTGDVDDQLRTALAENRFVQLVGAQARFEVSCDASRISIREQGRDVLVPVGRDAAGRALTVQRLERLARAEGLRELQPGGISDRAIVVEWGRVVDGQRAPLTPGEQCHVGEYVYLDVTNKSAKPLYVAVFDVGVDGAITLLTAGSPNGRKLEPNEKLELGDNFGVLEGIGPFGWPDDVPRDGEMRESIVVVYADHWTAFDLLETPPLPARGMLSALEATLDGFRSATTRNLDNKSKQAYGVHRIDFDLGPTPRSTFAVDESLDVRGLTAALLTTARFADPLEMATARVPMNIAVRITEITVHNNRALWGRTKIRLDSLAVTPGADAASYQANTETFPEIADGDRLPLDHFLVYEGSVARFLDFGVWISRDQKDARTLSLLLRDAGGDPDVGKAVASVAAIAVAAPEAAALAAAATGVATLASVASRLITAVAGTSVGLYRRSFLASERFGLGRHPANGTLRAQDFSFSYTIKMT